MLTLWDLIEPVLNLRPKKRKVPPRPQPALSPQLPHSDTPAPPTPLEPSAPVIRSTPLHETAQERYDRIVQTLLREHHIRVRKWRKNMSGIAWYVTYRDGSVSRLIETPRPKGPMSMAIFLHEVGHHAIGFNRFKPRCLEEYHAWAWAITQMEAMGLNITDAVRYRMSSSLWYAVDKARRRGLKHIPAELLPYITRPLKPRSSRA